LDALLRGRCKNDSTLKRKIIDDNIAKNIQNSQSVSEGKTVFGSFEDKFESGKNCARACLIELSKVFKRCVNIGIQNHFA
jgi:ribosomal protein S20